jgi:hypothetical protein
VRNVEEDVFLWPEIKNTYERINWIQLSDEGDLELNPRKLKTQLRCSGFEGTSEGLLIDFKSMQTLAVSKDPISQLQFYEGDLYWSSLSKLGKN